MIWVKGLTKQYGKIKALDNVSFKIRTGEIFGIVGPNGAGKSTLISIISTVLKPTTGDVLVDQHSIIEHPARVREKIGYVPQEIALYSSLSVIDNLKFWAGISRTSTKKITDNDIKHIVSIVGLQEKLGAKVSQLSGGMKRRLNIAVAMLNNPEIIIMDEPTVGVDIQSRREIIKFIKKLASQGKTIIYTSHSSEEIEMLCDRIVLLNAGKLLFEGSLEEAKQQAAERNIQSLYGDQSPRLDDILCYLGHWE
ncbi:MAG: linearmycin/streptolysin transport system ATP-binding protein [Clostridiales bacterium]|jgi:ABC-2 type transport system ATP-binding protein|nr:linearmycin/streptolysin transport system ATP-binding protein [Clostridiales bacterium]MDK2934582.1 linearmycin/streptolysin transport system ATP-binding protein [Clostridiales bacterium]